MNRFLVLIALVPLFSSAVLADDASNTNNASASDKWQYNLLHPTPHDLLRPLDSEAFDNVLDAHTLDSGHFQVEGNLVNYYKYSKGFDYPPLSYRYAQDEYSWTPRFRVGLWNDVDFEISPTLSQRSQNVTGTYGTPFDTTTHHAGFGDIGVGPKINLWGNDGGATSLAIHPYLSIPVNGGDLLGGVDVPFSVKLPHGFYLKLDTSIYAAEFPPNDFFIFAPGQVFVIYGNGISRTRYAGFDNSVSLHEALCSKAEVYWYLNSTVTRSHYLGGEFWFWTGNSCRWFGNNRNGCSYRWSSSQILRC